MEETLITDFSTGLFVMQALIIITLIIGIYALIDILRHKFQGNNKLLWFLFVFFVPFIGSLSYLILGRKMKVLKA